MEKSSHALIDNSIVCRNVDTSLSDNLIASICHAQSVSYTSTVGGRDGGYRRL